eukprot:5854711-Alexandrium_andersonii.AAC.1
MADCLCCWVPTQRHPLTSDIHRPATSTESCAGARSEQVGRALLARVLAAAARPALAEAAVLRREAV